MRLGLNNRTAIAITTVALAVGGAMTEHWNKVMKDLPSVSLLSMPLILPIIDYEGLERKVESKTPTLSTKPISYENNYSISQKGIDMLKEFEGYSSEGYPDVAGNPTIGYGHLIRPGENYSLITREEAEGILRNDIIKAEKAVNEYIDAPLTQNQYDTLVSFTYNVGTGALRDSTLCKKINSRDYVGASNEFDRWVNAGGKPSKGLINRRAKEKELYSSN